MTDKNKGYTRIQEQQMYTSTCTMNTGGAQELQGMNTTNTMPRIIRIYDEYRGQDTQTRPYVQVHVQS